MAFLRQSLWITDPWETLAHPLDTTLRLIEQAVALGVSVWWASVRAIRWQPDGTRLVAHRIRRVAPERRSDSFALGPPELVRPREFEQILYRTDPPVDLAYLHPLALLEADARAAAIDPNRDRPAPEIVNRPTALRGIGEKLLAASGGELMPPTLVATEWDALRTFGQAHGLTVAKPLHDCQSHGVELLDWERDVANGRCDAVLRALTEGYRRPALLQQFLPAVVAGETRLWLLDGALLCAVRKCPAEGTYRIDMDKGGTLEPHELTAREREKLPRIQALLDAEGVRLGAVDLIDGWVTDCNVTSPGLLPQMESVLGQNLARPIVEALRQPWGDRRLVPAPTDEQRVSDGHRTTDAGGKRVGDAHVTGVDSLPRVDSTSATMSVTGAGRANR